MHSSARRVSQRLPLPPETNHPMCPVVLPVCPVVLHPCVRWCCTHHTRCCCVKRIPSETGCLLMVSRNDRSCWNNQPSQTLTFAYTTLTLATRKCALKRPRVALLSQTTMAYRCLADSAAPITPASEPITALRITGTANPRAFTSAATRTLPR